MYEHIYLSDLYQQENQQISGFYLVKEKELREGKGGQFIRLKLQDRSSAVTGNIWKDVQKANDSFSEGDVVHLKAQIVNFKGQIQLSVTAIRFADKTEYDPDIFEVRSRFDPDFLASRLWEFIDKVENEYLNRLLKDIFGDHEFFGTFIEAPAAKSWHHNYKYGLIEHLVSVAALCEYCSTVYPVSMDLMIAGALLHDVGKVQEYMGRISYDFTDEGRLLGHISMADELICQKAAAIVGFPKDILLNLRHLILSHHGEYEKASVRLPQTLEAVLLHHCDNLDAQVTGVAQILDTVSPGSEWSEYDRLNNRYYRLFRIDKD